MGGICKQAEQVICWLGPDTYEEAILARELIQLQELARSDSRSMEMA
jgi:hypothetical protein